MKIVIITGGSKGIGASSARLFVEAGYGVVILDVDKVAGTQLATDLGPSARFYYCDVANIDDVESAVSATAEAYGSVDVLVNNAGILGYGTLTETSDEMWDRMMSVNLKGAFNCARRCIPIMMKAGSGVVINVSSVQAFITQEKVAAYTTAKTALLGLTRSIAVDYAPHIRCIAVCPGTIDTPMFRDAIEESPNPEEVYQECVDMHLTKSIGSPDDVARLIVFLASDAAAFMTGQAVRIDGGLGVRIAGSKQD